MNKKGFSLIEVLVALFIMSILSALLVPSFITSMKDSKTKNDKAAMLNLTNVVQTAFQDISIYKDARKVADKSADSTIAIYYTVNSADIVSLDHLEFINNSDEKTTDTSETEYGTYLSSIKVKLVNYVGERVEPIELLTEEYQEHDYKITITFKDVEFKVAADLEMIDRETD